MNVNWVLISVSIPSAITLLAATPAHLASQVLFLEIYPLVVSFKTTEIGSILTVTLSMCLIITPFLPQLAQMVTSD